MSLLLDALKKAEKKAVDGLAATAPTASNTPEQTANISADELSLAYTQPMATLPAATVEAKETLMASAPPEPAPPPTQAIPSGASTDTLRQARAVFSAKQAAAPSRRTPAGLWLVALLTLGAMAWWASNYWLDIRFSTTSPMTTLPTAPAPTPSAPGPDIVQETAPTAATPLTPVAVAGLRMSAELGRLPNERTSTANAQHTTPPRATPPALATTDAIRFARTSGESSAADPALEAYNALARGDSANAQILYEQALQRNRQHIDAMLGLATIAQQRNDPVRAEQWYRRALDVDPREPNALAGLSALRQPTDAIQAESHLKNLLAQDPRNPQLHFSLGNQLAAQKRWNEAQQSFFNAHTLEPENPDFAYNLAISLDQMRQIKPATQYYRRALELARQKPAAFNMAQTEQRLRELTTIAP